VDDEYESRTVWANFTEGNVENHKNPQSGYRYPDRESKPGPPE